MNRFNLLGILGISLLVGCGASSDPTEVALNPDGKTGRWYSQDQVEKGKLLFTDTCAACHGKQAESVVDWKTTDLNGNYPPPPLNGTAHAWHHPISVLIQVIDKGGIPLGGSMPEFENQYNDEEKLMLIASFQSYWTDKVYQTWLVRENSSRK